MVTVIDGGLDCVRVLAWEVVDVPRVTREQKQRNRERILAAAGEGFRLRGIDGTGIEGLMKSAGMTHGGFYNHFASKSDLAVEVLHQGFVDSLAVLDAVRAARPGSARAALHSMVDQYLDAEHRDHPEVGCPSAALVSDAGRHGAAAQAEYRRGLDGYFSAIAEMVIECGRESGTEIAPAEAREQAVALFSQMVGALLLSRAIAGVAPDLSDEVLAANRNRLKDR
ncbi:TetR family transcriptional regulator [Pseudonocardia saturnea]|uniref:TetR family transcriptional regulator n=2 Tax=Pseudonocardia TaxID=1847 RepID=A0ABQ0S5U0_9PSEU|nr:TetR/AcrR family transcriptional regulator [Pseudonocardia autotrophica]BBG03904.1 TetR family transcriptional regulator [Pseudonocardia autotrophica]GEC28277.1 TetR family transcriptional regulator [Pseudonocardia saturnea]